MKHYTRIVLVIVLTMALLTGCGCTNKNQHTDTTPTLMPTETTRETSAPTTAPTTLPTQETMENGNGGLTEISPEGGAGSQNGNDITGDTAVTTEPETTANGNARQRSTNPKTGSR